MFDEAWEDLFQQNAKKKNKLYNGSRKFQDVKFAHLLKGKKKLLAPKLDNLLKTCWTLEMFGVLIKSQYWIILFQQKFNAYEE